MLQRKLKTLDAGIELMSRDMLRAVALQAMFDRCADKADVIEALNNTVEAHGFTIVREALFQNLLMSLMRVHDSGRPDTASLDNLMSIVADWRVRSALIDRTVKIYRERPFHLISNPGESPQAYGERREIHQTIHNERAEEEGIRRARLLDEAIERFEQLKSAAYRTALKKLRNWQLAHTSLEERDHKAKYGYERLLLEATIPVFEKLALAAIGTD
jgi:hypothetical protein